jgi:type IV pilus assembly protein PilY1
VDGTESIRPYIGSVNDGVNDVGAVETVLTNGDLGNSSNFRSQLGLDAGETRDLFDVDKNTCKATTIKGNVKLAKVHEDDCARLMWGFATAAKPGDYAASEAGYAVRCPMGSGPGQSNNPDDCKPLGAIIHSSPAVAGPPSALVRDEGYRKYADLYKNVYAPAGAPGGTFKQRQTLYVSTTDGLLHAFDVNFTGDTSKPSELWAFVPPAVLPQLKTNFPGGQRNLLDGTPVVKDVVFERGATDVGKHEPWHTVLVSGLGKDGYFALDVSSDGELANASSFNPVTDGNLNTLRSRLRSGAPAGPHFLWQVKSTIEAGGSEKGKHKGKKNKKGDKIYGLFGDKVGTPVITTLFFNDAAHPNSDGKPHEIGVAILPGGIDEDVPTTGPSCPRRTSPLPSYSAPNDVMNPRANVRGWGASCGDAVAGRSVTIVRLDRGESVRHFARAPAGDDDVPKRLLDRGVCSGSPNDNCRVINSPFDAPVVGTPVVFPNDVGSVAQKAFVGDADGTLYRLDLSSPDPSLWGAKLFLDTRGSAFPAAGFQGDKPISLPPVLSLSENGNLVIGVANGDQEDLSAKPSGDHNLLWSVTEIPAQGAVPVHPELNWYLNFIDGERVTGPMAVFDKTLYFSTYKVGSSTTNVCQAGSANLYGRDYVKPYDNSNRSLGGDYRLVPTSVPFQPQGPDLIPGVSIRESQACATAVNTNDFFGGVRLGSQMTTPASFSLFANQAKNGGVNGNAVAQIKKDLQLPRTQTIVDSWASVVE